MKLKTNLRRALVVSSTVVFFLSIATLIAGAKGDGLEKLPPTLDKMIVIALKSNPQIVLAEAKVRQAQAELNETRLRVTKEVTRIYSLRRQKMRRIDDIRKRFYRIREVMKKGAATDAQVNKIALDLAKHDGELSEIEAEARYLLGFGGKMHAAISDAGASAPKAVKRKPVRPEMPERFHFVRQTTVEVAFSDVSLKSVLTAFSAGNKIAFVYRTSDFERQAEEQQVSITLPAGTTLAQALLALTDRYDVAFVFRDYGILVTDPYDAKNIRAATIPEDLPLAD